MNVLRGRVGWLDDITDWLAQLVRDVWDAFVTLLKDFLVWIVETVLNVVAWIIELIPVPDFLSGVSIASMLGSAGPSVAWAVSTFRIGECIALIAAAYAFRLLRKLLTLGQW